MELARFMFRYRRAGSINLIVNYLDDCTSLRVCQIGWEIDDQLIGQFQQELVGASKQIVCVRQGVSKWHPCRWRRE